MSKVAYFLFPKCILIKHILSGFFFFKQHFFLYFTQKVQKQLEDMKINTWMKRKKMTSLIDDKFSSGQSSNRLTMVTRKKSPRDGSERCFVTVLIVNQLLVFNSQMMTHVFVIILVITL